MSKRAEEAAWKVYPDYPTMDGGYITQRKTRKVFIQGYEAAEEDLIAIIESRIAEILGDAQPKPTIRIELKELITRIMEANEMKTQELTWEDIKAIVKIADDLLPGHDIEQLTSEFQTEESYYQEVLKRFKEGQKP